MSKKILTPRALNAHATKTFQKRLNNWHGQPKLAGEVAAILTSPNTPPEVRAFLVKAMLTWAEATDAVILPELARAAFIAMNLNTVKHDDVKVRAGQVTEKERRAFFARLAVVETTIVVGHAESSGEPIAINKTMRERLAEALTGASDTPDEQPEVIAPHVAPVVDLNCYRQSHARKIKRCIVDVKGGPGA